MSKFRCKPGNLAMAEAMPHGQRWVYQSTDPMSEMIQSRYFFSHIGQLRAGDDIRLNRMQDGRVVEVAEVLVTAADLPTRTFAFHIMRKPETVKKVEEGEISTTRELSVKKGWHCYEVIDDAGNIICTRPKREEAEALLPELSKLSDHGLSDFMKAESLEALDGEQVETVEDGEAKAA